MSFTRVGTDRSSTNVFIADWENSRGVSALDRALDAIIETGIALQARYAGRRTADDEGTPFTIDAALAERMRNAVAPETPITVLAAALTEQNGEAIADFDATGNAVRLLNVISRLLPATIRQATPDRHILIRLHAENNGTSDGGDVRWDGTDRFDGRRVALRADHSTLVHRRRGVPTHAPRGARPEAPRAGATTRTVAVSWFEHERRLRAVATEMERLIARVGDDAPARAATIAGTLEGYLPFVRRGRWGRIEDAFDTRQRITSDQLTTFEQSLAAMSAELTSLGC